MLYLLSYKHFFLLLSTTFDFQACKAREQNKNHVKMAKKKRLLTDKKINLRLNFSSGIFYKTSFKTHFF